MSEFDPYAELERLKDDLAGRAYKVTYGRKQPTFILGPVYITVVSEDLKTHFKEHVDEEWHYLRVYYSEEAVDDLCAIDYVADEVIRVGFRRTVNRHPRGDVEEEEWDFGCDVEDNPELIRKTLKVLWEHFVLDDLSDV